MADYTEATVVGKITLPDGEMSALQPFIVFSLHGFDSEEAADHIFLPNMPGLRYAVPVNADGTFTSASLNRPLWANGTGRRQKLFSVSFECYDEFGERQSVHLGDIRIDAAGTYDLEDLLPIMPPPGLTVAEYVAILQAEVAKAEAAADTATTAVQSAQASAQTATTKASEAAASAQAAADSAASINPNNFLAITGGTMTGAISANFGGNQALFSTTNAVVGIGSGAAGFTINDGHGNSNVVFNHKGGTPDNASPTQSAGRISFSTDASTGMFTFSIADNTSQNVTVPTQTALDVSLTELYCPKNIRTFGALVASKAQGDWIATKPEAEAGTNNDQVMTPLRTVDSIAANQAVQAWINFSGTTNVIRASHNVTSIPEHGTGDYSVNFTTAMPDENYAIAGFCGNNNTPGIAGIVSQNNAWSGPTASSCRIRTGLSTTAGAFDPTFVMVAFFR